MEINKIHSTVCNITRAVRETQDLSARSQILA